jgi:pimeloyl-ACP methyl ester carboxylesterase
MAWFEHSEARIYYEERGQGQPVLVMPGFSEGLDEVAGLIDVLAGRYRAIAAELPGSGRSQPQPREYTPDFYRQDAHRMAELLQHLNTSSVHVLGYSDGGEVGLLMAVDYPELVRSLVIWGAAGTLGNGEIAPLIAAIGRVMDEPIEGAPEWSDQLRRTYGEEVARATVTSWSKASLAILRAGGDISLSRAAQIKCPVLVIHGKHDPFCTPAMARDLAERIPNAEEIEVPDVGHPVHSDRPDWLNKTALDWLSRQS